MTESSGLMGKYLLKVKNASIQVGIAPVPEFFISPAFMIPIVLLATIAVIQPEVRVRLRSRQEERNTVVRRKR